MNLDSAFASEVAQEMAGTPLSCHRPMIAQPLAVWTPARIIGALFMTLLSVPLQLVPAVLIRRRA